MASIALELVAGRVLVRVHAHELFAKRGPVACFSYVTEGLRSFGQREIVFTLAREPRADPEQAPREPLALLRAVANLAARGQLVGVGGFTELGPTGMLGRPSIRGVAYQIAWPMEGVSLPEGTLAAVALVGAEMDTVKRFGALRVLARLGRVHGFFPTAPWCDPDREAAMEPESRTILEGVATGYFEGVSVTMDGERIALRIDRAAAPAIARALPGLPPDAALVMLAALDPEADACLVWSPGQQQTEAITPPESRAARPSGCFALLVPQQAYDGGNPFEDGFAMMLTDASWARVRSALLSATAVTIPAAPQTKALAVEWA